MNEVETWVAVLIPWGVAAIGGAGLYLRFARQQSGRINTSEAAQLWEEARSMRASAEKRAADCEERERLWLAEQRENERRRHGHQ